MKKEISYKECLGAVEHQLTNGGAFLITADGKRVNVMTIGWGGINYYWKRPVFIVPVRQSRYTKEMLGKNGNFTVCVPVDNSKYSKELAYCGTKSGRDTDKIADCSFDMHSGEKNGIPYINGDMYVFECKTLLNCDMADDNLADEIAEGVYGRKNYHTLYFGEVLTCYKVQE